MSDEDKVVSLFSRKAAKPVNDTATVNQKPDGVRMPPGVDPKSVITLNSVIEDVLKGECSGVCVIATGKNGLARFWLSFPEGESAQRAATRYIGLAELFKDVLVQVVYNGIETETE